MTYSSILLVNFIPWHLFSFRITREFCLMTHIHIHSHTHNHSSHSHNHAYNLTLTNIRSHSQHHSFILIHTISPFLLCLISRRPYYAVSFSLINFAGLSTPVFYLSASSANYTCCKAVHVLGIFYCVLQGSPRFDMYHFTGFPSPVSHIKFVIYFYFRFISTCFTLRAARQSTLYYLFYSSLPPLVSP